MALALENPFAASHEDVFFVCAVAVKGSPWSSFSAVWVTPCNAQPATLRRLRLWSPEKTERQRERK